MIEQALFTMQPGKSWDEQPVAQTRGIEEEHTRELASAMRALSGCDASGGTFAISFFPLSEGKFCVARTVPCGGRGQPSGTILTHCLVVDRDVLARFANNPFALLHAALAERLVRPSEWGWPRLSRFSLEGCSPPVDTELLTSLAHNPGLAAIQTLIGTALCSPAVAIVPGPQRPRLLAALLNCLPVECRPQFSFTTGPAIAKQSTFRLFCLDRSTSESSLAPSEQNYAIFDPAEAGELKEANAGGWSGLLTQAIAAGRVDWLASQLGIARPGLRAELLDSLSRELRQKLAALEHGEQQKTSGSNGRALVAVDPVDAPQLRRSDVAHETSPSGLTLSASEVATLSVACQSDPSQELAGQSPIAVAKLEKLDDLVFEAIAGKPAALVELRATWPEVLAELGRELIEESQSQYLRHAMSVWRHCLDGDELRNPRLAVAAVEVITILLNVT